MGGGATTSIGWLRWALTLSGLAVFVFAVVALTGPGRIDNSDGQTRFEVGRSLAEHGDPAVRDPRVCWSVFPGRGGASYSYYRLPHSLVAAAAIAAADATGPAAEGRRHFFFTLAGAIAAALLVVAYAVWFRRTGLTPRAAAAWAAVGVFCTPNWYYGTSTYDDLFGAATVVVAIVVAYAGRSRFPLLAAATSGLLVGLAFHWKQPLGLFGLPVAAAVLSPGFGWRRQAGRMVLLAAGLTVGIATYVAFDEYKFPPETRASHAALLENYAPNFPGNPVANILTLTVSPAAGVLWYCPPVVLAGCGLAAWLRRDPRLVVATVIAGVVFVGFLCSLTIAKGDPSWGPRYLTPLLALLWLFAPAGAARLPARLTGGLLAAGFVVQLLGLSVDPHRLYLKHDLPSAFYSKFPWLYFHPTIAHLPNRPWELVEILRSEPGSAVAFSPSPSPTFGFVVADPPHLPVARSDAVRDYQVLRSPRFWCASFPHLSPAERPVDLGKTAALLAAAGGLGLLLVTAGLTRNLPPNRSAE